MDLAAAAATSASTVSRVERGHLDGIAVGVLRRLLAALDVRLELVPRARSGDLDRLVNARHTALAESVIGWVQRHPGWELRPELSFGIYGERGVVDLLAWHPEPRALLVTELKTEIVDVGELLGTLDRKRRLARQIVAPLGWRPHTVGALLVVAESMTNRRRIAAHAATFEAALPDRLMVVRRWLTEPAGELRGLMFFSDSRERAARGRLAAPRRVRLSASARSTASSRSAKRQFRVAPAGDMPPRGAESI